jgi:hypothetical protein
MDITMYRCPWLRASEDPKRKPRTLHCTRKKLRVERLGHPKVSGSVEARFTDIVLVSGLEVWWFLFLWL